MGRWSLPIKNMKIQFTAEEITQALTEYCSTYKSLKLSKIELGVDGHYVNEFGDGPEQENFWATADFEIMP